MSDTDEKQGIRPPPAGQVAIQVGDLFDGLTFYTPLQPLCEASLFFSKAFKGKFREAHKHIIHVPDAKPWIFRCFLNWVNTGEISYEWNAMDEEEDAHDPISWRDLIDLYSFADQHDSPLFRDAIVDFCFTKDIINDESPSRSEFEYMATNFRPCQPLYKLCIHLLVFAPTPYLDDSHPWEIDHVNGVENPATELLRECYVLAKCQNVSLQHSIDETGCKVNHQTLPQLFHHELPETEDYAFAKWHVEMTREERIREVSMESFGYVKNWNFGFKQADLEDAVDTMDFVTGWETSDEMLMDIKEGLCYLHEHGDSTEEKEACEKRWNVIKQKAMRAKYSEWVLRMLGPFHGIKPWIIEYAVKIDKALKV